MGIVTFGISYPINHMSLYQMRRQGQYTESGVHPMLQQQHPYPPQQLSGNAYSTQDPLWPADSHYSGSSWPAEGQWHRDRDFAKDPNNKISSYSTGYTEGKCYCHCVIYPLMLPTCLICS